MSDDPTDATGTRRRLLERWLPLAQQAQRQYGWSLDPRALEQLIVDAAEGLDQACTSLSAYAVFWDHMRRVTPASDQARHRDPFQRAAEDDSFDAVGDSE